MKLKSLIVSIYLLLPAMLFAQQQKEIPSAIDTTEVFRVVNKKAYTTYKLNEYLSQNLIYPQEALVNEVHGKVVVEFIIEKDGRIADPKIVKGKELAHGIPEEALRVIRQMPAWEPAERVGKKVRSYYILPIQFNLAPGAEEAIPQKEEIIQPKDTSVNSSYKRARAPYKLSEYIEKKLQYPYEAKKNSIEGKVNISFTVEVDGSITNVMVSSGRLLGHGLPEEAVRIISEMPKWIPAEKKDGQKVKSYFILPIVFTLVTAQAY